MKLQQAHYLSGTVIFLFVVLHLSNHVVSLISVERHIEIMEMLRPIYRNIFAEPILLLSVVVQIVSGVQLFMRKRTYTKGFYDTLQIYSGLYMAFFFVIHVSAVLIGRNILQLDTNFYFGAAGLNTFPFNLFFIPYYGLAIISFFAHIAGIHYHKVQRNILGLNVAHQSNIILTLGVIITSLALYGLTNKFQGVALPTEYLIMIGK